MADRGHRASIVLDEDAIRALVQFAEADAKVVPLAIAGDDRGAAEARGTRETYARIFASSVARTHQHVIDDYRQRFAEASPKKA
jgi:hypothetical protein